MTEDEWEYGERLDATGQVWTSTKETAEVNTKDPGWSIVRRKVTRGPWQEPRQ